MSSVAINGAASNGTYGQVTSGVTAELVGADVAGNANMQLLATSAYPGGIVFEGYSRAVSAILTDTKGEQTVTVSAEGNFVANNAPGVSLCFALMTLICFLAPGGHGTFIMQFQAIAQGSKPVGTLPAGLPTNQEAFTMSPNYIVITS